LGEVLRQSKEIDKIRVLDPACGSGSFLIKAFDVISEFYKEKIGDEKFNRQIKNNILTQNIYGVDLDPKAVEIAQLNLFLKIGEKGELPTLRNNIKCGNSLIEDPNISDKAFKWERDFEDIIKEGRFDVIIGNPPYIRSQLLDDNDKRYFKTHYTSAKNQYDIYILFIEKAIDLLKNGGYLGFIMPNKLLISDYGLGIRKLILKETNIVQIIDVSNLEVFSGVGTYPIILILRKQSPDKKNKIKIINDVKSPTVLLNPSFDIILQENFCSNDKNLFITSVGKAKILEEKIKLNCLNLGEITEIYRGVIPESQKEYVLSKHQYDKLNAKEKLLCRKALRARFVDRYNFSWNEEYFFYHKNIKIERSKKFELPKIIMPRTVINLEAAYDAEGYTLIDRLYYIRVKNNKLNSKYILGILNSKLISFYYRTVFGATHLQGGYLDLKGIDLEKIPIKVISDMDQSIMIELVDKMLTLNKKMNKINVGTNEKRSLEEEIKKIDKEIDDFAYKIYDITDDEKKIIEESLK
jgi:type I restriction-modification system DNA methylase subunit